MKKKKTSSLDADKHPGRGGKRAGAGRPMGSKHIKESMRRVPVHTRLPKHLVELIKDQPIPLSRVIQIAVELWEEKMNKPKNDKAMQTLSEVLLGHVDLLAKLKAATQNQEDYIKMLEMSNTKLSSKIDVLQKGFNEIIKAIPKIAD